jgi:hypothetical protein
VSGKYKMELRTFIKTALLDIINGITDAQESTEPGIIVPAGISRNYESVKQGVSELQAIDFEVCVRAEKTAGTEAKLGVVTAIIGAGLSGKQSDELGHSSTLKFRIPINLPTSKK